MSWESYPSIQEYVEYWDQRIEPDLAIFARDANPQATRNFLARKGLKDDYLDYDYHEFYMDPSKQVLLCKKEDLSFYLQCLEEVKKLRGDIVVEKVEFLKD